MQTTRLHAKAWLAALVALGLGAALAATPPNTAITNTASATYGIAGTPVTITGSATVTTVAGIPATIRFLQYAPGTGTTSNVAGTQCNASSGSIALPAPMRPGGPPLAGAVPLSPASVYASGDPVFVRVIDYDQNNDPLVAETVTVTVTTGADSEKLRLTETGPSTGEFIGYVPTASSPAVPGSCMLNVASNARLLASYFDQSTGSVMTDTALIDPLGLVFDSSTGLPVDGAQVTLVNVATGLPATVFGNDGVSSFPATVTSGGTATDSGGAVYRFGPGRYQFPRVAPGTYRLAITQPAGYVFASVVPAAQLQSLAGSPFLVVTGSRGETFALVPGPPLEIDVPLDPKPAGTIQISKTAGKAVIGVGEFMPYSLAIRNTDAAPVASLRITDRLPPGFRYQAGSARIDSAVLPDPRVSADGRGLEFTLGALPGNGAVSLRYVAAVQAGAPLGMAENTAQAAGGATSNIARASVFVRSDLNRTRAILLGRVTLVESCDNIQVEPVGLKGVRVLLEDGTYIVTDTEGRWHADNIRAGTHVVQLDETSLPAGYELQACEQNTRTAGRRFSQFVNVQGGTLWRADFRLRKLASCMRQQIQVQGTAVTLSLAAPIARESVTATVMLPPGARAVPGSVTLDGKTHAQGETGDGFVVVRLGAQAGRWQHQLGFMLEAAAPAGELMLSVQYKAAGEEVQRLQQLKLATGAEASQCAPIALPKAPPPVADTLSGPVLAATTTTAAKQAGTQLVEILPYDDKWIAAAAPGAQWLHPQADFVPALPVVKVAVKHEARDRVELKVNGAPVNALRYEGTILNPAGTLALSNWRAVDLQDGANQVDVIVRDAQGVVVLQESRTIHYAVGPSTALFDEKRSRLVADGRTSPVIAVRLLDKEGKPVRRGAGGELQITAPYLSQEQADALRQEPLTGNLGGKARYQIGADGIASIALQPTTQAGEVVLKFDFGNGRAQEVRAWLTPDLREWVLVGFAEGGVGFKKLSGNMESLDASGAKEQLFDQNRLAFYAKGQVKGEYLMTIAYDSAKERNAAGSTASPPLLNQAIDPNQFYTLYGDATQPQFDAASARKLYLKIEKSQFYAMFGDYTTGLSVTELGRYSRTLNGFKSEYKGDRLAYNAFASQTAQGFRKDEIQGDGTSGLYRLAGRDIVINSDQVRLEVRDRFRPEIIVSSTVFTRYLDYQIDYALGTLSFREPVRSRDANFNPVFIVAEYESAGRSDSALTYGGRISLKIGNQPGEKSEVGLTRISEGTAGREASLAAVDTTIRMGDGTKLRAEAAISHRNSALGSESGNAYLVELSHVDGTVNSRAYVRQQDAGFGLGQQAGSEAGTRKVGADARVQVSENLQLQAEAYRQENLVTNAQRDVVEARTQWKQDALTTTAGLRSAHETDDVGHDATARQAIGGMAYEMLDKKLVLRASTELDAGSRGSSSSFPSRLIVGTDYKINPQLTVFSEHERAQNDQFKVDTTRAGLRLQPWTGAELAGSLGNQVSTDAGRTYANLGLVQKWQISPQWAADVGIDRSQTLRGSVGANPFNAAQPPVSGSAPAGSTATFTGPAPGTTTTLVTGDYTAVFVGAAYRDGDWSANARIEVRESDTDGKVNLLLGVQRNLEGGRAVAAGLNYNRVTGTLDSSRLDARLSYAHRPNNSQWIWLDRLQYIQEAAQNVINSLTTRKLINNLNANWQASAETQVALQYGLKYVRDSIDGSAYTGTTDLIAMEVRHDLSATWDAGLHMGMLRSWKTRARDYQLGVSVGHKVADNAWLSLGYNERGFMDADFSGAQYRARGLQMSIRMKFDQDSFNLNERSGSALSIKP